MTVEGFDGERIQMLDEYRADMLAAADSLRRRANQTRAFGDLLTGDMIARGAAVVESISVRNQNPLFQPLYLTFLENQDWIPRTDVALLRMKKALTKTPKVYREFVSYAADQPMGGLFELNAYDVLDLAFPGAEPQPKLNESARRSDVRIVVDGISIFVEATVLGEGAFWNGIEKMMHQHGLSVYATSGPGPDAEARRIISKVGEELTQTAPDAPNIILISFFGTFPSKMARDWAFPDLFAGGKSYGSRQDGSVVDLSHLRRVDSIFEFSRDRLTEVHVNPVCDASFKLTDAVRRRIRSILAEARFMIR